MAWFRRNVVYVVLLLIVVGGVGAALLFTQVPQVGLAFENEKFSSEKWIHGNAETRGRMVRDLMGSQILQDQERKDVDRLLGPPDVFFNGSHYRYRIQIGLTRLNEPEMKDFIVGFGKGWEVRRMNIEEVLPIEPVEP